MDRRTGIAIAAIAVAAAIGGGAAAAAAAAAGGEDAPIPSGAREEAVEAALERAGSGSVVETEIGDDGAAYAVELRLGDGTQVEVRLDERFHVIGMESDDDPTDELAPGTGRDDD